MSLTSLYICYFGLREPLVQTQVLPYIREIRKADVRFVLLTFEPAGQDESQFARYRKELAAEGIDWHWLRYHKRFSVLATAYDIFRGTLFTWRRIGKGDIDIVHSRVQVPQLIASIARRLSRHKPKLLFDIRGFFPEEYTDSGSWPENGWLYRAAKRIESWLLQDADGFVILTEKARTILFPESAESGKDKLGRPVQVIPCCIDSGRFELGPDSPSLALTHNRPAEPRITFVYIGSMGGWYLTDELMKFFAFVHTKYPNAFTIVITQRDVVNVKRRMVEIGLDESRIFVDSVSPENVAEHLMKADIAVSFIKKCYSKQASSPTKFAEYLASGLPVISNSGIGDLDLIIASEKVGALIDSFTDEDFEAALTTIEGLISAKESRDHCRSVAFRLFDLETVGGTRYRAIYSELLSGV